MHIPPFPRVVALRFLVCVRHAERRQVGVKIAVDAEERILTAEYNTKLCEISLMQISGNILDYLEK